MSYLQFLYLDECSKAYRENHSVTFTAAGVGFVDNSVKLLEWYGVASKANGNWKDKMIVAHMLVDFLVEKYRNGENRLRPERYYACREIGSYMSDVASKLVQLNDRSEKILRKIFANGKRFYLINGKGLNDNLMKHYMRKQKVGDLVSERLSEIKLTKDALEFVSKPGNIFDIRRMTVVESKYTVFVNNKLST